MVSALDSVLSSPSLSPGRGHCIVCLGKTLDSHSASLFPGLQMNTGKFNAGGNPIVDHCGLASHPGGEGLKYS